MISMVTILESRHQYRSCHIRLPDDDQRVAAILVNGKFYSLLKIVRDRQKALKICDLLTAKGGEVVITRTARGDAIWLWEADAIVEPSTQVRLQAAPQVETLPFPCRVLNAPEQYQMCHIRVPEVPERLEAIYVGGKYYSLFKADQSAQQSIDLVRKLQQRGDEPIVTRSTQIDTIWVLEPDAVLA
jgi:hypothetical protein